MGGCTAHRRCAVDGRRGRDPRRPGGYSGRGTEEPILRCGAGRGRAQLRRAAARGTDRRRRAASPYGTLAQRAGIAGPAPLPAPPNSSAATVDRRRRRRAGGSGSGRRRRDDAVIHAPATRAAGARRAFLPVACRGTAARSRTIYRGDRRGGCAHARIRRDRGHELSGRYRRARARSASHAWFATAWTHRATAISSPRSSSHRR